MIDYLNNVECEYCGIRRTLRTAATKNHVILRHLYRSLPEESDKLGCHASVIQVTLSLTHDNGSVVDWRMSIFRVADPIKDRPEDRCHRDSILYEVRYIYSNVIEAINNNKIFKM